MLSSDTRPYETAKEATKDTVKAAALFSAHLDREEATCRGLLTAAEAKRAAVIANTLPDIVAAAEREERIVGELARLRTVRTRLFAGLAKALGLPTGTPLRVLAGALAADRPELSDRIDRLHELARRIDATNLGNQALLRHSLEVINGVLDHLTGTPAAATTYGPTAPASVRQGFLDFKA